MTKLKPCPFCGGEAHHMRQGVVVMCREAADGDPFTWSVECKKCGVRTKEYPKRQSSTRAWNRRK